MDADLQYHLRELAVARDPNHPGHLLPTIPAGCSRVLDIGCGAGQSLASIDLLGAKPFGTDYDLSALTIGKQRFAPAVPFACASGEALPYAANSFDFVFSRVALPYMNLHTALCEIDRVLIPGGHLWFTLHPLSMLNWKRSLSALRPALFEVYRLANTAALHYGLPQFRFPLNRKRTESYQTEPGIRRTLKRIGFADVTVKTGSHFLVTARKPVS